MTASAALSPIEWMSFIVDISHANSDRTYVRTFSYALNRNHQNGRGHARARRGRTECACNYDGLTPLALRRDVESGHKVVRASTVYGQVAFNASYSVRESTRSWYEGEMLTQLLCHEIPPPTKSSI
jgi:hypothetical protein